MTPHHPDDFVELVKAITDFVVQILEILIPWS